MKKFIALMLLAVSFSTFAAPRSLVTMNDRQGLWHLGALMNLNSYPGAVSPSLGPVVSWNATYSGRVGVESLFATSENMNDYIARAFWKERLNEGRTTLFVMPSIGFKLNPVNDNMFLGAAAGAEIRLMPELSLAMKTGLDWDGVFTGVQDRITPLLAFGLFHHF